MCRWLLYFGDAVCPANILFFAGHGLINQSEDVEAYTPEVSENDARNNRVNVHGSGLGWYPLFTENHSLDLFNYQNLRIDERPGIYTGAIAPSHDRNLRRLARSIRSHLIFSHIRAAGPFSPVHEFNCHPFQAGRYMFMHNGGINRFAEIKRDLCYGLPVHINKIIYGSTDSEVAFALFLSYLPDGDFTKKQPQEVIEDAFVNMIAHLEWATGSLSDVDEDDEPVPSAKNSLNFAVTDGNVVVVSRFRSGKKDDPPSLYIAHGACYKITEGANNLRQKLKKQRSYVDQHGILDTVLVSSEPLDFAGKGWRVIPKNTVCTIYPQGHPARSTWESNRPSKAPLEISYIHLTRERLRETVLRRKIHSKEDTREFTPAIYGTPAIRAKEKRNKTLAPLLKLALTLGVAFLASAVVRK